MARFLDGLPWRFIVVALDPNDGTSASTEDAETLSFLDRLASSRVVVLTLNRPAMSTGLVPSDNPEVNIPRAAPDSEPFVNYADRLLYGFQREQAFTATDPPWVCRFGGMLLQLEDVAGADQATSAYTAFDPWQYLYSRPICNASGALPGPKGISYTATRGDVIALQLVQNTIDAHGPVHIDVDSGTFEPTAELDIRFDHGSSVGEAWAQLCATGTMDIVLDPVYDPLGRPGVCVAMNVYAQAGEIRNDQVFAWDRPSRSLVGISRLLDGSKAANKVQYYLGQGGQPVTLQEDAASVARIGEWWAQQFFPGNRSSAYTVAVEQLAAAALALRKRGRRTLTISPASERSPIPLVEYGLGDRVPVYASDRLRQPIPNPGTRRGAWSAVTAYAVGDIVTDGGSWWQAVRAGTNHEPPNDTYWESFLQYQRVYSIPIEISDDQGSRVTSLLASPDGA